MLRKRKSTCFCATFASGLTIKQHSALVSGDSGVSSQRSIELQRMNVFKLQFVLMVAIGLSGCASLVTEYIQHADGFDYGNIASEEEIALLGFDEGRYCSPKIELCISYLSGGKINARRLKYETETKLGESSTKVTLNLNRDSVPIELNGTVVLFHGFRASKEFMLNTALYFRFLGFDVLVPDLLGHGESDGEKAYGVGDRHIIDELISSKHDPEEKLFLLGNSMGAVTAAYLSKMRPDVDGIILQAPMLRFDEAVLRYTKANHPYLTSILSDDTIISGSLRALSEANLTVIDTDIHRVISTSSTPLLLFASSSDPVAPYDQFEHMSSAATTVKDLPNRNHPSMSVVGDESSKIIINWLNELTSKASGNNLGRLSLREVGESGELKLQDYFLSGMKAATNLSDKVDSCIKTQAERRAEIAGDPQTIDPESLSLPEES